MPETGKLVLSDKDRGSWYSHKAETARPYYYKAYLADYDVTAEIAPTERAAMLQFTYPATDAPYMVIDVLDGKGSIDVQPDRKRVVGKAVNNHGGVPDNFANYFVIEFDRPFTLAESQDSVAGIRFEPTTRGEKITARVASSFISTEQAEQNLKELGTMTDRSWRAASSAGTTYSDALRSRERRPRKTARSTARCIVRFSSPESSMR